MLDGWLACYSWNDESSGTFFNVEVCLFGDIVIQW